MKINKQLIKYNYGNRKGVKIEYIVVHDTGNSRRGAGAYNNYLYFNSGIRNASAHYFIDDKYIIQTVEDTNVSWHCGDGKGRYNITNSNSIGIEICINEDSDYETALENTIILIRILMELYQIPKGKVVRHFDASRKICPISMSNDGWRKWSEFWCKI